MRISSLVLGFLCWITLLGGPAWSVAVLDLGDPACHNVATCSLVVSGNPGETALATLFQPEVSRGRDDFFSFPGGMIFGSSPFPHAFSLSFDRDVELIGSTFGLFSSFGGFEISGPNLSPAGVLMPTVLGPTIFPEPVIFASNTTYRFDGIVGPGFSFAVLSDLSFNVDGSSAPSVVPLPASVSMLLASMLALGSLKAWRSRRVRSRRPDHGVA